MAYDSSKDKILWESNKYDFKPKATLHAAIKSYDDGEPKLTIVEEGEGFGGKPYSNMLLKRVGIEDIETIKELLDLGNVLLEEKYQEWFKKKENK